MNGDLCPIQPVSLSSVGLGLCSHSRTTSRQLSWWLEEYGDRLKGLDKKTLDVMDREHLAYNYKTGELTPLTDYEWCERKDIRRAAFNYGYGW